MSLNSIKFNKLHLQNKPVQVLIALCLAAVILVAAYFAVFQGQWDEYKTKQDEEETLKTEYTAKSIRAANLENLEKELLLIEESIDVLLKQLPTEAEIPGLIQEMHQAAAKNNLTMSNVTPGQIVIEKPIERLPIAISVTGSYEQIAQFVRDIGKMSRIVTLANINLSSVDKSAKDDGSKLTFTATANTYKAMVFSKDASDASDAASSENS